MLIQWLSGINTCIDCGLVGNSKPTELQQKCSPSKVFWEKANGGILSHPDNNTGDPTNFQTEN